MKSATKSNGYAAKETEKTIREKFIPKTLKQKQIDDIVKYERIDGGTINQWFKNYETDDTRRIFQAVQRGVSEGTTLQGIMKQITGGSEEFGDAVIPIKGALETSRESARMIARTTINGVANATRMEVYEANADVLDGVQWLATLDTRTCPVCGELDGKIWKTSEMMSVKRPPAHPSCRCVLLPYIDLGETDSTRAAEVADFDKMAEDRYNEAQREKGSDKRYADLSYDTRKKKRYDEIREWKKDGKEPYRQVKGNYIDYVKTLPPDEQRRLLGKKRFEMLKAGTLTDEQSKKPDSGYRKTLDDLKPKDDNKKSKIKIDSPSELLKESEQFIDAKKRHDEAIAEIKEKYKGKISSQEFRKTEREDWRFGKEVIENLFPKDDPKNETRKHFVQSFDAIKHGIKTSQKDAKEAADLMGRVVGNLPNKPQHDVFTVVEIQGRSFYKRENNEIHLATRELNYDAKKDVFPATAHEISHWIEETPEIKKKVVALYDKITYGDAVPIPKGKGGELYKKSKMKLPFEYCTRDYAEEKRINLIKEGKKTIKQIDAEIEQYKKTRPTELLSVFFEQLLKNPASILDEFPEYFDEIIKVLR